MKSYLIPLIISTIVLVGYFSISQIIISDKEEYVQCIIPNSDELLEPRIGTGGPNDGKPRFSSLTQMFSIYSDVGINSVERHGEHHSLLLTLLPHSYGYIVMCDPLPNLQKMYNDDKIVDIAIFVDGKEIAYEIVEDVFKINVNNNTRIEIAGVR